MLTLVCLFTGEWRLSSYVSAAITCITLAIAIFVLPESHIWLKKKGRFAEAEASRRRIAAISGVEFVPQPAPELKEGELPPEPEKGVTILNVFQDPTLRRNLLVLWVMWFVIGMTAYLTDLSGGDMTKNFWIGQFLSGILLSAVRIVRLSKIWLDFNSILRSSDSRTALCLGWVAASSYSAPSLWPYSSSSVSLDSCSSVRR